MNSGVVYQTQSAIQALSSDFYNFADNFNNLLSEIGREAVMNNQRIENIEQSIGSQSLNQRLEAIECMIANIEERLNSMDYYNEVI